MNGKNINNILKKIGYNDYSCEPSSLKNIREEYNRALNCSDIESVKEQVDRYVFKNFICRPVTKEELEWIEEQPKLDLNAPENEGIRGVIEELYKRGWFD